MTEERLDLNTIRKRLAGRKGRQYWRSLAELAETEQFQAFLQDEFPRQAAPWLHQIDRRGFLKLLGASLALAGLTACNSRTSEKIVPYVQQPPELTPGKPLQFATAMTLSGYATGLLVESHEGRPTKVEGNPDHPASLGASDIFAQASVLTLYDPDRSQVVSRSGQISTWEVFLEALNAELELQRTKDGAGLHILTETVTSPTLAAQLQRLLERFPAARWHQYEPVNRDNVRAGARLAFGEVVQPLYHFDQAEVILALGADFLQTDPGKLRYAREFSHKRRPPAGEMAMNRLYVVESTPTITGAVADHRLPLRAGQLESLARAVGQELGIAVEPVGEPTSADVSPDWISAVASDIQRHRGASLVLAGEQQPPLVHALAHAMNDTLGNVGQTVVYTDPVEANPVDQTESLGELVTDMAAGEVDLLIMLGGNPVFTAPADLNFAEALTLVGFRVHLSLYDDETSNWCHWHIPAAHYLESWGDARAYDGTVSIIQPLIEPLYQGKSAHTLLAALLGQPNQASYDIVRAYWQSQNLADDFEPFWRKALHDGLIPDTALPAKTVSLRPPLSPPQRGGGGGAQQAPQAQNGGLEIQFQPDPTIWDGRFANNGWLQELPKPLTKLTWDNAALISPATAERLGLANEELVELRYRGRTMRLPVWVTPGQADGSVAVQLGYGRRRAGNVGTGTGFDTYAIRASDAPWFDDGLKIHRTDERYPLASTQQHHLMEGRDLVRMGTLAEFKANPLFVQEMGHAPEAELTLYPQFEYEGYAWGMAIDLSACIGCNACVIACQAENNIPVVGKDEVARGREMHWIRLDRYYSGDLDNPEVVHQPVPCMHCENAPCEQVCPVAATVHSSEGLNEMVYNRCVGTRYCSNNCPYKVRRFNFLAYSDRETPSLKLLRNPEVTVRERGVMEKCTYCVQRINAARIEAKKADRPIRDGEIVTACQQACPTQAIVFGNINDPEGQVAQLKASPLNYDLLAELNTRPRTSYLAKLRNPNPEIETA